MPGQGETTVSVPLTPTRSDLYWRRIFNKYDRDADGKISYAELKEIIESREYEHDLPDNVVEKIMKLADRDNSGYLDFNEFVEMMHNPDFKAVFGHFVARYVHSIVPHRGPVDTTGRWPGLQYHSTRDGGMGPGFLYVPKSRRDGTYEEEYSCWPPAICMILISVVEIVMFCYDAAHGSTTAVGPLAKIFIYNPHKRHEAWRFITYMFVHVGVVHLLVNLLVQLFLGVPLEMVHRWWRVTLVYLAGVAAGSLATSLTDPRVHLAGASGGVYALIAAHIATIIMRVTLVYLAGVAAGSLATSLTDPRVHLAGASGGVYALIAAHIATIIMNWAEMEFAIIQLLVFLLLAAVDIGTAVYDRYWGAGVTNIGYVAHLAGAVAGLLVGIGVLRNLEKRKWEKRLWWAAVIIYCSLMIAGILANVFWVDHFPESKL